jgi:hypothetical protein
MDNYTDSRKNEAKKQKLRRRFEARELLFSIKSGPCADCQNKYHPCQMDLMSKDNGGTRLSAIMLRSKRRLVEEASRRDLVCANCGRLRNWKKARERASGPV